MSKFTPDYRNIVDAASNISAKRLPLYEHIISEKIMAEVLGRPLEGGPDGSFSEALAYFRDYCGFFERMGYDTVSYEECITAVLPGGGALGGHKEGVIKTFDDFKKYPWRDIPQLYFQKNSNAFKALKAALPAGMKAIGGVGNGVFECVQDLTGYTNLCYISVDDPELYEQLFIEVGKVSLAIWKRFLDEFGDAYCVCRFGDDLGFKNNTLISAEDIVAHVIPQYRLIIDEVHRRGKKFLLHSCGDIFNVMDSLIDAGIDAKHSNEDQIARFPVWVERYGDRIGNFGGIDTDAVCRLDKEELREYIFDVLRVCDGRGGIAFGSGNSIPEYVPVHNYCSMVETVREYRGDFKK